MMARSMSLMPSSSRAMAIPNNTIFTNTNTYTNTINTISTSYSTNANITNTTTTTNTINTITTSSRGYGRVWAGVGVGAAVIGMGMGTVLAEERPYTAADSGA